MRNNIIRSKNLCQAIILIIFFCIFRRHLCFKEDRIDAFICFPVG